MTEFLERLRLMWDNFTSRERVLVAVLGGVFGFLVLFALPLYLMHSANAQIAEDNRELRSLLDKITLQQDKLVARMQEREATEALLQNTPPPLGGFLESKAKEHDLSLREVNDQPDRSLGKYRRRGVKVSMTQVAMTPVINLLSGLDRSRYPVAVNEIRIEHYRSGDNFNVSLGIVAFDKKSGDDEEQQQASAAGPE